MCLCWVSASSICNRMRTDRLDLLSRAFYSRNLKRKWAAYCGMKYGVAVSNGTTALQVAVGCRRSENRVTQALLYHHLQSSPVRCQLLNAERIPVLMDSDPETWCMDVTQIEAKITSRTKRSCQFIFMAIP